MGIESAIVAAMERRVLSFEPGLYARNSTLERRGFALDADSKTPRRRVDGASSDG
jgi:hypothetical protein